MAKCQLFLERLLMDKNNIQAAIDRGEVEDLEPSVQLIPPESFPVTGEGLPIIPLPDIISSEQMDQLRRQISGRVEDYTPLNRQYSA